MNILFILEDALRPDHLGCYGYGKPTSPVIDRLARDGVVFRNAIATASHTLPPIVSLLMSQWSCTHGVVSPARFQQWVASPAWRDRETPLKILSRKGFLIDGEMVTRWKPLGFSRDTDGKDIPEYFERHRDEHWFFMAEPYPTHLPYNPPEGYFRMFLDHGWKGNEETERRLKVVRSCLIVHPSGVVSKLEAGESEVLPDNQSDDAHKRTAGTADLLPEDEPAVRALYDGEVRVFDDLVGGWVGRLEELGLLDETLIIITADHGEELMERGHVGHCSCNLKGTLHDESIRVPLILRYPPGLPRGKVVEEQVSQVDLMPTIFELLGMERPGFMEGESLIPLIRGATSAFREEAFAETTPAGWQALQSDDREMFCVRTGAGKLILKTDAAERSRQWEFYDLREDPHERRNIYPDHPLVAPLVPRMEWYVKRARAAGNCIR
jgi:arylsulfatase A-like enzyme